jgi:hypothetical protein
MQATAIYCELVVSNHSGYHSVINRHDKTSVNLNVVTAPLASGFDNVVTIRKARPPSLPARVDLHDIR